MRRAIGRLGRGYGQTVRRGLALWRAAPAIPLIAIVPEFVQHVVEIRLGMFASKAAFRGLAYDPLRWDVGSVKIAGFWIAVFAALIVIGSGAGPHGALRSVAWPRFAWAITLNVIVVVASGAVTDLLPANGAMVVNTIFSIATLPLLVYLVGALLGDPDTDLRAAFTRGWSRLLDLVLLAAPVFAAGQAIHMLDHTLAVGRPLAIVWLLMIWDALWVGGMTCCTGAALAIGYRLSDETGSSVSVDSSTARIG